MMGASVSSQRASRRTARRWRGSAVASAGAVERGEVVETTKFVYHSRQSLYSTILVFLKSQGVNNVDQDNDSGYD